jgi:hypothetical protein
MDIVVVFNGLGNQMSQYAFYLAKRHRDPSCRAIFNPQSKHEHNGLELERLFGIGLNRTLTDRLLACFFGYIYNRRFVPRVFRCLGIRTVKEPQNYDYMPQLRDEKAGGWMNFYWGGWK